ncbi:MAG: CAP domain-containing protein [Actinomycetota bacterium]|nr:CAP domain-containing protein [Actinomycetota bacterium]
MQTPSPLQKAALGAITLLVAMVALPLGVLAPAVAHASAATDESRFFSLTNQLRASVGAPALTLDAGMSDVARAWSQQMAAAGNISHNPNRQTQITGWSVLGENVGMGSTLDILNQALVNSPPHHENLVDAEFTLVGIGVAYGPNMVYVTEDFMTPSGSSASQAAPDPVPTPAVDEAPAPAPRPARTTTTAPTTTAAPVPTPEVAPPPPPSPAPDPVPTELMPVVKQLQQWTAVFFPGSDPSIALTRGASDSGNGRRGH